MKSAANSFFKFGFELKGIKLYFPTKSFNEIVYFLSNLNFTEFFKRRFSTLLCLVDKKDTLRL